MILDKIVARKKEEVADLLSQGMLESPAQVDPPRGFIQSLVDFEMPMEVLIDEGENSGSGMRLWLRSLFNLPDLIWINVYKIRNMLQ